MLSSCGINDLNSSQKWLRNCHHETGAGFSLGVPMLIFVQDIRFAFRQFRNHPGFALTATLPLALGIGATVSVFSIVYAVLMNPWPYIGADRICGISFLDKAGNEDNWSGLTGPQIRQLRQAHAIEDVLGVNAMIKLRPGFTRAAAAAELLPLFQQFAKETPDHFPRQYKLELRTISYRYMHELGATLGLLFGAVGLLLAIGCGNVSILLLARGTARQHEFAVRSAVGANGLRIVRQLLTESLILAVAGAGLGMFLAYQSLGLIVARLPEYSFPHEADFHVNMPVLLFSVGLALLTSIVFGLFPALQFARPQISQVMQSSTRKLAGTVRGKQLHTALIAGQIALTLLLMTAASPAIQGFLALDACSPRLQPEPRHVGRHSRA